MCVDEDPQSFLFEDGSPAAEWDRDVAQHALDGLFSLARQYRSSGAYRELIDFVVRFHFHAPFNAMLVHVQMPGAVYVAPPHRWLRDYHRHIKAGARPLVILQPMGPVMFVFDVSDTEPEHKASPLPTDVTQPFEVRYGHIAGEFVQTLENAKRDGIHVTERDAGSQSAGAIRVAQQGGHLQVLARQRPELEYVEVPRRYEILLNRNHSAEAKYATLVHELAHLYCGHLGTPNNTWWPDRRGLARDTREFEAESVCYLICTRLAIDNPSDAYLGNYLGDHHEIPPISLDCVMRSAGLIEQMGRERLTPRRNRNQ
jgi:hypothetical protein